jgi:hypothetical protein
MREDAGVPREAIEQARDRSRRKIVDPSVLMRSGQRRDEPGPLDGEVIAALPGQVNQVLQGLGKEVMSELGGGPGGERRIAQVDGTLGPANDACAELSGILPTENRTLHALFEPAYTQQHDRPVAKARSDEACLLTSTEASRVREGLLVRAEHERKSRDGDADHSREETAERRIARRNPGYARGSRNSFEREAVVS